MPKKIIGGVFANAQDAEMAINQLKGLGYQGEDISVFAKDKDEVKDIENHTDTDVTPEKGGRGKNAGKGAGIGAVSGGVLGGIVGLIAEAGLLAIPGIGPLVAAGPIATTLAGLGIGAGSGGIVGALVGLGIPEEQAKEYEGFLKDNRIIVMVEANEENQSDVYRIFISNKTENTSMYPEEILITENRTY
ncbi:low temperature-induced protein [Oceanobacillus piezotolerans]|uniref:Low temperature-induced protein n=1 Tax=Oceanobacillus piezotolerans TaxID=2448030 RepID=A0A498D9P1_9BACI|nr:general stress protein [Oceanobacillus piezotolerans]RLL43907.1 low temperature-induced protein [Oceanobacillus piezotolerans]